MTRVHRRENHAYPTCALNDGAAPRSLLASVARAVVGTAANFRSPSLNAQSLSRGAPCDLVSLPSCTCALLRHGGTGDDILWNILARVCERARPRQSLLVLINRHGSNGACLDPVCHLFCVYSWMLIKSHNKMISCAYRIITLLALYLKTLQHNLIYGSTHKKVRIRSC